MKGYFNRPDCQCPKDQKRCKCGAKWAYTVDIGTDPKTGKRKQKKKRGFTTRKAAQDAVADLIANLNKGTHVNESNIKFEDFAEEWISMYQASGKVKISTIRVRRHEIKRLLDYFAKLKIREISRKKYQDTLNGLHNRGFATNTIDGAHRTGRMIFKKAVEMEIIKKDPSEYAVAPRRQKTVDELEQEKEVPNYLEKEELAMFLRMAKKHGLGIDHIVFKVLAYTGMRVGELSALKWSDIDLEEGTIGITKTYYNPKNNTKQYQLLTPKTLTSKRNIDIDPSVISDLEEHKALQNKIHMKHRKTYHDENFVFTNLERNHGYPLLIKMIDLRMDRLLKLAKLNESLTPHSLRHTHTSLLAEAGANLPEIMERLGHKDDDTTKNVYLHVTKTVKKETSHKFAELMKGL